ncbi:hypothetical protein GH733_000437 [Mirounga leonina]|nr:hypothetical protein GH733_000437 [Mirounga leonina]
MPSTVWTKKINEVSSSDDKDAFCVVDLGDILKKHLRWLKALPQVTPFDVVECNDNRTTVKNLAAIGTGFDFTSKTETPWALSLRVPPETIIYANPNRSPLMISKQSAASVLNLVHTQNQQSSFGAKELHPDVISVSSHVGSGYTETFRHSISDTGCIFDMGAEYLLDINGGFLGSEDVKLKVEEITSVTNPAPDKCFPASSGTGSNDEDESSEQTFRFYVNDGVYGSFNCIIYDHAHMKPLMQKRPKPD